MKRLLYLVIATALIFTAGCAREDLETKERDNRNNVTLTDDTNAVPGQLLVKFNEGFEGKAKYETETRAGDMVKLSTGLKEFDIRANEAGITRMERIFPDAGKFEPRSRAAGLHLWYLVEFDESQTITRTAEQLVSSGDISYVEPVYEVRRIQDTDLNFSQFSRSDTYPRPDINFDDPRLSEQWHYFNDGTAISAALEGSDARIFQAWELETGRPEVIISIVDGGIDITHEDIIDNLWYNESERNGAEGVDDDGNGYKDDINGYNFVSGYQGKLVADLHGTHVAGTIAAKNNNGTGVSGIAGGDGTPGSGARLMSCQIAVTDSYGERWATTANIGAAIKYGADNGAVISQNSWGMDNVSTTPLAVANAIRYFVENAGIDENGNQTGPMRGGLVIFAAGNDNTSAMQYPASMDEVIAVAAIGPTYRKASYSNYGTYVDITAPGGDIYTYGTRGGVLSTMGGYNGRRWVYNDYGFYQGTSMACPHVSGVAALLISYYGADQPGLTADDVKEMLFETAYDLDAYNPTYVGLLGCGAMDAGAAIRYRLSDNRPPVVTSEISDIALEGLGARRSFVLTDHFTDPDGDTMTFGAVSSNERVAGLSVVNGTLTVTSAAYGTTTVTVTATDPSGASVSSSFEFKCSLRNPKNEGGKEGHDPDEMILP